MLRRFRQTSAGRAPQRLRAGFVMDQSLGHITYYHNLRRAVADFDEVDSRWVESKLETKLPAKRYDIRSLWDRLPGVPSYVRQGGRALIDMRRGLRGWPYDVLIINTQRSATFGQWAMLRTPTLLAADCTPALFASMAHLYHEASNARSPLQMAKNLHTGLNFHLASALIPWSSWVRDSMIRDYGIPRERLHVIPPGVDTNLWRVAERPDPAARVQLLFVGGDFERKGGRQLLDVFRSLNLHERADLHLVTRDAVEPSPGVAVHRNVQANSDQMVTLYRQADLFVLPTLADCTPFAVMEAMASSLPVITTAVGGIPEMVTSGDNGYLVPPGEGRPLGEALARLIGDPALRAQLGARARERAVRDFDAKKNARRLLDVAQAVAQGLTPQPA